MENTQANLVRINIGVIILFVLAECVGCKQSDTKSDGVVIVDVTASYPKKRIDSSGLYGRGVRPAGDK